jgi:hypothetical protein
MLLSKLSPVTATAALVVSVVAGSSPGDDSRSDPVLIKSAGGDITWLPTVSLTPTVVVPYRGPDPDLESGFPVQSLHTAGSFHAGASVFALVGNIDGDPQLEILATSLANGPLNAWNFDGSIVPGWPQDGPGPSYASLGELSNATPGKEVFAGHIGFPGRLQAWDGNGMALPGWPRDSRNYVETPATLADIDFDGIDEIFVGEDDRRLHGYRVDGSVLPGWPVLHSEGGQTSHTPAVADLDGDGDLEILTITGSTNSISYLYAHHHDGSSVPGFPVVLNAGQADGFPVIGDVDGDGQQEIVVMKQEPNFPSRLIVTVLSSNGAPEREIMAPARVFWATAPALADLDGDAVPEIIVLGEGMLYVWKGDGSALPGWPQSIRPFRFMGNSAPVVGDLTGDCQPEIAVTNTTIVDDIGELRVYDRRGHLHPRFPKVLEIEQGGVPAIADVDLDGRNELVVISDRWSGVSGYFDKVWVYDLGGPAHGPIQWGQFMGAANHQGRYRGGNLTPCAGFEPASVAVDPFPTSSSDGDGMLEPGETVVVSPSWRSIGTADRALSSRTYSFTGPRAGHTIYSVRRAVADYGIVPPGGMANCDTAGGKCFIVSIGNVGARPSTHWDSRIEEMLSTGATVEWTLHVSNSFTDVPKSSPSYRFVETALHHGLTTGCDTERYCPDLSITREEAAAFVLRAAAGPEYVPAECAVPLFQDVPPSSPYCPWIEELARRGVVSGCGDGKFCPSASITRSEMAVLLLATRNPGLTPTACNGTRFADVPATGSSCGWIAELVRRGIVTGCRDGGYYPSAPVTREQAAVFVTRTFDLELYGR